MDGRVRNLRIGPHGGLEPEGRLEGAVLRAVEDLGVVKQRVAVSEDSIFLHEVSCDNLAAEGVLRDVSYNPHVSCEEHDLASDVNAVVLGGSRLGCAVVIV